jgi:hypothetical protein
VALLFKDAQGHLLVDDVVLSKQDPEGTGTSQIQSLVGNLFEAGLSLSELRLRTT